MSKAKKPAVKVICYYRPSPVWPITTKKLKPQPWYSYVEGCPENEEAGHNADEAIGALLRQMTFPVTITGIKWGEPPS